MPEAMHGENETSKEFGKERQQERQGTLDPKDKDTSPRSKARDFALLPRRAPSDGTLTYLDSVVDVHTCE